MASGMAALHFGRTDRTHQDSFEALRTSIRRGLSEARMQCETTGPGLPETWTPNRQLLLTANCTWNATASAACKSPYNQPVIPSSPTIVVGAGVGVVLAAQEHKLLRGAGGVRRAGGHGTWRDGKRRCHPGRRRHVPVRHVTGMHVRGGSCASCIV